MLTIGVMDDIIVTKNSSFQQQRKTQDKQTCVFYQRMNGTNSDSMFTGICSDH